MNPIRTVYLFKYTKKLSFPNYKFGKGKYAFYPIKLSHFAVKNKVCQKYQNFMRGDPCELGRRPL